MKWISDQTIANKLYLHYESTHVLVKMRCIKTLIIFYKEERHVYYLFYAKQMSIIIKIKMRLVDETKQTQDKLWENSASYLRGW